MFWEAPERPIESIPYSGRLGNPREIGGVSTGSYCTKIKCTPLRTVFLADYFVNPVFRREILRVLNRGEATNALKRLIYTGRVAGHQAKSQDEMQAVADALSLLANIVMAWNTVKMQSIFDRWAQRRSGAIPPELIARCAPTRTEGLNMRGIFQFLIEQYADALMPSRAIPKTAILEA